MKITIHHHRKIGQPEFSSLSFGATLEIDLQHGDPHEVEATFRAAAADLRRLVEAELARESAATPANGNGSNGDGANGNGTRGTRNAGSAGAQMISAKQIKFLRGLSGRLRLRPRDLDKRAQEMAGDHGVTVRDLTKRQASDLIESMLEESEAAA